MAKMFTSGNDYEGLMGRHSRKLAPLFADFVQIRDQGSLLDIGCGTGSLTQVLAERTHAAKIVGIDPNQPFVDHARARFSHDKRITIDQGSAVALPYADKSFDQSMSLLVLMFIADADKAVTEMKRVTKPGGTVAACVWHREGHIMSSTYWEEAVKLDPSAEGSAEKLSTPYYEGKLADQWRKHGFKDVVETPITIQMEFKSFDDYWNPLLTGTGPAGVYTVGLPEDKREKLRLALKKRHLENRADSPYSLPERRKWSSSCPNPRRWVSLH